jgi:N-acetylglucosaminyldiphosphoundecaprenol N-acetyl-beta-D-mannosaminyltransferase
LAATAVTALTAIPTTQIVGVPIHMTTLDKAVSLAEAMIRTNNPGYFCHVDTHAVLAARDRPEIHAALSAATLTCPDGMPLVWVGRRRGFDVGRTYGPDFMEALIAQTAAWTDRPCRHFLFGSSQEVLDRLAQSLVRRSPGTCIAGMLSPPFGTWDETTDAAHRRAINDSGADVVWVSLGAPRQEQWMHRNRPYLTAPLLSGVGAAFDFLSGNKPQAPRLIQRSGLEWAFRLATEPRRLARRYLRTVPRFAALALWDELRRPRSHPAS